MLFCIARLYVGSKIVCFYESHHAFKTIWRRPCFCHLIKIKGYFLKLGRPVFIIVINSSCSGVCYRIYARQKFQIMPERRYPVTNALTIGIYYYNKIAVKDSLHIWVVQGNYLFHIGGKLMLQQFFSPKSILNLCHRMIFSCFSSSMYCKVIIN